ncbi:hypothetical protein MPSEU_000186400 [Mayamaea pseudoterrestris]|nr:hypothetical protein MPSEU_000186400 [Mayamaea pseudoterrestris]
MSRITSANALLLLISYLVAAAGFQPLSKIRQSLLSNRITMTQPQDPFALFGSSDDDDDDKASSDKQLRDPSNGAMAFHQGTEQALLQYVRNGLHNDSTDGPLSKLTTPRARVLHLVDDFCHKRHWMMHVGDEKGSTLQKFLAEAVLAYETDFENRANPFVLVEIGTYCGYSLVRMIDTLLEVSTDQVKFHIITVDVSASNQAVAKEMAQLAGVQEYVTFVQLKDPEHVPNELSTSVKSTMEHLFPDRNSNMIDFLFIDHEKSLYLSDLLQLEQAGMIQEKTRVCADNVVVFQLDEYRGRMQVLAEQNIVETRLVMAKLEYSDQETDAIPDGLELTTYLKDPV